MDTADTHASPLPPAQRHPVGEAKIWLSSMGISLGLIMIFGLLGIIIYNGCSAFWPQPIYQLQLSTPANAESSPTTLFASIVKSQTRHVIDEAGNARDIPEHQIFTGNKELYGQGYRYIDASHIKEQTAPESLMSVERLQGGTALIAPLFLTTSDGKKIPAYSPAFIPALDSYVQKANELREEIRRIENGEINIINSRLGDTQRDLRALEMSYSFNTDSTTGVTTATAKPRPIITGLGDPVAEREEITNKIASLQEEYASYLSKLQELMAKQGAEGLIYHAGDNKEHTIPVDQIVHFYQPNQMGFLGKVGVFITRAWNFIFDEPREANTEGGVFPAIFGTFVMTVLMSLLVTPLGVIGAVYLREYAKQGRLVKMVRICVNNLAGVPSIVFGVFGLGFFVYFVGGSIDQLFFSQKLAVDNTPTFGTSGILWASLTLALMTLPVVIVSTEEALAAVPRGLREAALACGASKWQMIQRIILPSALPGVMTGLILAMARGAGEVAPLMVTGVVKLAPSLPLDGESPFIHLERKFMHLGFHIFDVGFQSPDSDAARPMVFATTLLLIILVVVMNFTAIAIRNRLRKKYQAASF